MNTSSVLRLFFGILFISSAAFVAAKSQTPDSILTQQWRSATYNYGFMLPAKAKFNELGSTQNAAGKYEMNNFMLSGGFGSISISYRTEERMVPKDFKLMPDSTHYYDMDSTGRNGIIHRRVYILTKISVQIDVLLTDKGKAQYESILLPLFDSFVAPPDAEKTLPKWRYGRNPKEFENDEYRNGMPNR